MEGEELRKNILVICLSLMLIMSNYASFVSYANPLDPISDLIPSIDDEAPAPPEKPAEEQLAEDTINKVWKVVNTKVLFTFNTGKPVSALNAVAGVF